jgi:hypothetical protein
MLSRPAYAKRVAPPELPSLIIEGVKYQAFYPAPKNTDPAGMEAFVRATRASDGEELWKALIFRVTYNVGLETDVQDIFITDLKFKQGKLTIRDERNRAFVLDLKTKKVKKVSGWFK